MTWDNIKSYDYTASHTVKDWGWEFSPITIAGVSHPRVKTNNIIISTFGNFLASCISSLVSDIKQSLSMVANRYIKNLISRTGKAGTSKVIRVPV